MAASPRALHRITVWWRCNRGRSSVLRLTLAHAPAGNRNRENLPGEMFGCLRGRMPALRSFLKFIARGCWLVFSFGYDADFFFFVVDERVWRHAVCKENIRTDSGICADDSVAAHDCGAGVDANAVFDCRMALFSTQ